MLPGNTTLPAPVTVSVVTAGDISMLFVSVNVPASAPIDALAVTFTGPANVAVLVPDRLRNAPLLPAPAMLSGLVKLNDVPLRASEPPAFTVMAALPLPSDASLVTDRVPALTVVVP